MRWKSATMRQCCHYHHGWLLTAAIIINLAGLIAAHPTMYKVNDNRKLEADLVPVSSTVIPLPVYKVSYGINVAPYGKDEKLHRPQGPISLITSTSYKKKPYIPLKEKDEISIVKEVKNKSAL